MKLALGRFSIPKITLPSIGLKKSKSALALHWTNSVLRLLELDQDKKPKFEPVEIDIQGKNMGRALKELVQRLGLEGKDVSACLPANEGLLKLQKFPSSLSDTDLRKSIEWYIKREMSSYKEEMVYDY
ncbi:MAG: pilus assembly protein PilM, partial [Aquificota bacterium]